MKRATASARALPLLLAAIMFLAGITLASWYRSEGGLNTAITELVPLEALGTHETLLLSRMLEDAPRRLVFLVEGESAAAVEGAAMALETTLARDDAIARLDARPDPGRFEAYAEALVPWRDSLLAGADRLALLSDPTATVDGWLEQSPLVRSLPAEIDPLGTLGRFLTDALDPGTRIESDGFFYWLARADGEPHAVTMFADLATSAVDTGHPEELAARVAGVVETVEGVHGVDIAVSGAALHAAAARQQARAETTLFGGAAGLMAIGLLAWLLGGVLPVLRLLLVVGGALLAGFAAAAVVFPDLHVLALVLAVPVIGIAVDYLIHAEVHRRANAPAAMPHSLARALAVACASSVLAFLTLAMIGIPLLQQLAIVSTIGLTVALLIVVALSREPVTDAGGRVAALMASGTVNRLAMGTSPGWVHGAAVAGTVIAIAVVVLAGGRIHIEDSPAALTAPNASLAQDDARIGRRLDAPSLRTVVLLEADDVQQLRAIEAAAIEDLHERFGIRATGLSALVPPAAIQQENRELLHGAHESAAARHPGHADPDRAEPDAAPLAVENLPPALRSQLPPHGVTPTGAWSTLALPGTPDLNTLIRWCASRDGCRIVDSLDTMGQALARTHTGLRTGLATALVIIGAILCLLYRRRGALAALVLTAVVAAGLAVPAMAGLPLTLFGTCGAFLLLGLSIDYLAFMLEGWRRRTATWLAIGASAATSVATFGLLLASGTPAVRMMAAPVVAGLPLLLLLLYITQQVLDGTTGQDTRRPSLAGGT